jgi:3-deoxy-D-manno-oct-2-ulosonic acid (Kdo) hydroxylase
MRMDSYRETALHRVAAPQECSPVLPFFDAAGPDAAAASGISAALESNHIVWFPHAPLRLPDKAELEYLRRELPSRLRKKNVSYHPAGQRLTGLEADAALSARTTAMLRAHLDAVTAYLRRVMPHLCVGWTVGKCSFRPIEERGRDLPPHASNELVHVDAGAYGATNGDRVLRFFVNVNEHADRVWASKGSIQEVLERHGAAAGLFDAAGNLKLRIHKHAADHAFSFLIRGLAQFNDLARALDSSPYDRAMRQLHNYMKDSDAFRTDMRGYQEIRFPPGSAWMVFTDGVSHACLSGQFALVTTIIVRREAMRYPQFAPYNLLAAHAVSRSMTSSG